MLLEIYFWFVGNVWLYDMMEPQGSADVALILGHNKFKVNNYAHVQCNQLSLVYSWDE